MYEIGQQVVCVKTHSMGVVKEGNTYTIRGMKVYCDGRLVLDVGIPSCNKSWTSGINKPIGQKYLCNRCNKVHVSDGIWWINAVNFRPLDDLYNTEIEELMNEVNEKQPFEV